MQAVVSCLTVMVYRSSAGECSHSFVCYFSCNLVQVVKVPEKIEAIEQIVLMKFYNTHHCWYQSMSEEPCKFSGAVTPDIEFNGLSVVRSCSTMIYCLYSASGSV